PAIVVAGNLRCLPAPSTLAALGTSPREVAVKGGRAAFAIACALHGCRGKISLTAALGGKRGTLGSAAAHVPGGRERLVSLKLGARGRRALRAAGGLAASLQLEAKHRVQRL